MSTDATDAPYHDRFSDWYGFDTENDKDGTVTLTCLVHEGGESWIWKKAGDFVDWCDAQKGTPVVICHNLEYDLVNEFQAKFPYLQLNYLKGNLVSAKYKRVNFLDSFNHFRMSLKKLGECLGIKKLDMDIHSPEYVKTDAWICLRAMTEARDFIARQGGRIGATSGSSAVSIWKTMTDAEYFTGAIDTPWLRRGYYGGRTEIFRRHTEGNIKGYDINSMYPYAMIDDYPEYMTDDPTFIKSKGMVEATVEVSPTSFVGPLPYRAEDSRLLYPTGVFRGVWTYDEVRWAERYGAKVLRIHKAVGCNSLVRPFDDFINTLYEKRKATTVESERLFYKVLMNSLYGKIAAKSTITRTVSRYQLIKTNSKRLDQVKWIDHNRGLLDYTTPPPEYVNMLWGAMITANARLQLLHYLMKCPPEKLIYCDTDSLYCLDHVLPTGNELGEMKLEKEAKIFVAYQPKAYQMDEFYKAKGVPKPKYSEDGKNIVIDYAKQYMEEGYTEFDAPIRFRQSLRSKQGSANTWVRKSKGMRSGYTHKRELNDRYWPQVVGHPGQIEAFKPQDIESKPPKKVVRLPLSRPSVKSAVGGNPAPSKQQKTKTIAKQAELQL